MTFWNFVIFNKMFLKLRCEYANKWIDDVISSQFSINFVHRNDEHVIFQLWESKTCPLSKGVNRWGTGGTSPPPTFKSGGGGGDIISFVPPPPLFWIKPITENMKSTSILLFCLISATQCIKMSIFDGKYSKSPYRGRGASPPPTPPPGPARSLRALAQCPPPPLFRSCWRPCLYPLWIMQSTRICVKYQYQKVCQLMNYKIIEVIHLLICVNNTNAH